MDDVQPRELRFSPSGLRKVMRAGLHEVPLVTRASSGGSTHGLFLSVVWSDDFTKLDDYA
jgi:hypothetical protein